MLPQAFFQATTRHPIPDVEDRRLWVWPIIYREKNIDYSILMEGVLDEIVCLPLDVRNSGSLDEVWTPSKRGFDAMGMRLPL